jgi:hypothetical protein
MSYNDLFNEYSKSDSIQNLTSNPAYLDYVVEGFEQWFDGDTDKAYELATKLFTDIISNKSYAQSITDIASAEKAVASLAAEKGISLPEAAKMIDAYAFNNKIDLMSNGDNLVNEAAYNLSNNPAKMATFNPTASLGDNVFGGSSYNDILINSGVLGLDDFIKANGTDTFEEALASLPYQTQAEFKGMLDSSLNRIDKIKQSIVNNKDFDANELLDIFSGDKASAIGMVKELQFQGKLGKLSDEETIYLMSKLDYIQNGKNPSSDYNASFDYFWNQTTPQITNYFVPQDFYDGLQDNMFDANALSDIASNKEDFLQLAQDFIGGYNVYAFAPGMKSTIEEGMKIAGDLASKVSKGAVDEATAIQSINEIMDVIHKEIAATAGQ